MRSTARVFINLFAAVFCCIFALACICIGMWAPDMSRGNVLALFALALIFVALGYFEYGIYANEAIEVTQEGVNFIDRKGKSRYFTWDYLETTYTRGTNEILAFKAENFSKRVKSSYSDFPKLVEYIDSLGHLKREKSRI